MTSKRWARKALVILALCLALCALFGRTLETMTMPRVKRAVAVRGRLESRLPLEGALYFSDTVDVTLPAARQLPITVESVLARPGDFVQAGDALLICWAPAYAERMRSMQAESQLLVRQMTLEYASHTRVKQTSPQNELTERLLQCAQDAHMARYAVYAAAALEGCAVPEDMAATGYPRTDAALIKWSEAQAAYDQTASALAKLNKSGEGQVSASVYDYVLAMDAYRRDIDALLRDMAALDALNAQVALLAAPHSGYILEVNVSPGDGYGGAGAVLTMSAQDAAPVLRADISHVTAPVRMGDRVTLPGNVQAAVGEVYQIGSKRYLHVPLDEAEIASLGGMDALSSREAVPLTLLCRSEAAATLLPASAVRVDASGQPYVYRVEAPATGGLLGAGGMTLVKMPVTVLEKGEQMVSVADELSFATIAYQEDRPLREGQAVLEYTD